MALLLARSVFLHVPKTGGTWAAAALERAGAVRGRLGPIHASPDEIRDDPAYQSRPVRIAMVRHPVSWYASIWAHRMDEKWGPVNAPDWLSKAWTVRWDEFTRRCNSRLFPRFIEKCARAYPDGWFSTLVDAYTTDCSHIARQETAADDLVTILREAGEAFAEDALRNTPPHNVRAASGRWSGRIQWTTDLLEMVAATERRVFTRFGYATASD